MKMIRIAHRHIIPFSSEYLFLANIRRSRYFGNKSYHALNNSISKGSVHHIYPLIHQLVLSLYVRRE